MIDYAHHCLKICPCGAFFQLIEESKMRTLEKCLNHSSSLLVSNGNNRKFIFFVLLFSIKVLYKVDIG
jgi:hypothetical protein